MPSDALQPWLAHVARERAGALARACAVEGWAERPEGLRQVRIAARRLRSVVELMEEAAPAGTLKVARRWTRALGRLRGLDVMARLLSEGQARARGLAAQAAAEHLLEGLDRERRKAAKRLGAQLGAQPDVPPGSEAAPVPPSRQALWDLLTPLLREALEPLEAACRRGDAEALHRTRLAAKRLRYALEVLGPAFKTSPDQALLALKALQDALGLGHDWTELALDLEGRLQRIEPGPRPILAEGLELLHAHARREAGLALAQASALAGEMGPLTFATLLRSDLGDLR